MTKPSSRERDLTPDVTQRRASKPSASVWVNASAGSGKTTVLTNRVMRLLLDGVPPQKILCLTYTRAAAAEMALRVMRELSRWATCSEAELDKDFDRLQNKAPDGKQREKARRLFAEILACPGGMRIRTIHAFCQEILRRFPIEAGLPPHFAVIEEADASAMREEAQGEILRMAARQPEGEVGKALRAMAGDLGEYGFGGAMKGILGERARLHDAVANAGGLEKLIARVRSDLSLDPAETTENIRCAAVKDLDEKTMRDISRKLLEGGKKVAARGQRMLTWLDLPIEGRIAEFDEYLCCFFIKDGTGTPIADVVDKPLAKYPELEGLIRREESRLDSVRQRLEATAIAEDTAGLLTLGVETMRQYEKQKRARASLDYDDLIIRTENLLARSGIAAWVLYKLDGGIDHILVDEAQDTSRAQWRIVASLAEEFFSGAGARPDVNRTLFVVGDEKQSIFSFQRADPEAFDQYRRAFEKRIKSAGKEYDEVPMRVSFRSAPAVLRAVDAIFARDEARRGVSQVEVVHEPFKKEKMGRVEVWPLVPAPEKDEEGEWDLPLAAEGRRDPAAELADRIADKIRRDLDMGEILPGDIMILLRRRGEFAALMVRALKKRRIPVTGVDRMNLTEQLAVMDLLALVQFSLLPEDDLNLATVLKGPLVGFSEDDLMKLAIGRGQKTLWTSFAEKIGDDPRFATAHGYLSRWLGIADFLTPFDMLAQILNENCPASAISGMHAIWSRLGLDAIDPVNELLNAAQDFSQRHTPSLQGFLHWLIATETEIKREMDHGDQRDGGQVRIMTVHAAKGLEAPVVYLPDAASLPRAQDVAKILWNNETPFYIASRPRTGLPQELYQAARERQMEEYRRLMYVALTRPQNELYIAGWEMDRNEGNSADSWHGLAAKGLGGEVKPVSEIIVADAPLDLKAKLILKRPASQENPPLVLPGWMREAAPVETVQRVIAPSQFILQSSLDQVANATPDERFARGRIIHRLMESLPDLEDGKRDAAAARFLASRRHRLTPEQQKEIAREVLDLLRDPQFAPLFGPGSRAEVPLAGKAQGAAQVDRLCLRDNEVWIVDYKTNRPPPADASGIPEAYRLQMAAYRAILRDIYPDKTVRCFLLWTYKPLLMEVRESI